MNTSLKHPKSINYIENKLKEWFTDDEVMYIREYPECLQISRFGPRYPSRETKILVGSENTPGVLDEILERYTTKWSSLVIIMDEDEPDISIYPAETLDPNIYTFNP